MLQVILDLARNTDDGVVTNFATIRGSGKFAPKIKRWPAFALPPLCCLGFVKDDWYYFLHSSKLATLTH